jgi:hypothetical protein
VTRNSSPTATRQLLLESNLVHLLQEGETRHGLLIEHDAGSTLGLVNRDGQLLTENYSLSQRPSLFTADGLLLVHCILQKADTLNRNGRVYPQLILERENRNYQTAVSERMASGEVNHPDTITLDLHNLGMLVTRTWWEGKALMGELEVLVSPRYIADGSIQLPGDKIAYYLEKRMKLGISSRGLGSVKKINGQLIVQNDFGLIGFDFVQSPSTTGSYIIPGGTGAQPLRESLGAPGGGFHARVERFGSKRH